MWNNYPKSKSKKSSWLHCFVYGLLLSIFTLSFVSLFIWRIKILQYTLSEMKGMVINTVYTEKTTNNKHAQLTELKTFTSKNDFMQTFSVWFRCVYDKCEGMANMKMNEIFDFCHQSWNTLNEYFSYSVLFINRDFSVQFEMSSKVRY